MARKRKAAPGEESRQAGAAAAVAEAARPAVDPKIEERTRQRAYEIYERRMASGEPGDADGDWRKALAELGRDNRPSPS